MNVSLQLSPSVEAWDLEGQNQYFGGGYRLSLTEESEGSGSRLKVTLVRDDQEKFTVHDFHTSWELTEPGSLRHLDIQPRPHSTSELSSVGHRVLWGSDHTELRDSVCFGSEP